MKPGPAISTSLHTSASTPLSTTRWAISPGFDADLLRERQRTVDLRVGTVGGTHDGVGVGTTGDLGEHRSEQVGTIESGSATSPFWPGGSDHAGSATACSGRWWDTR